MESMSYILFVCVAVPVAMMLLPIEKKSRKVVLALLVGMFCCLFVSEINGLLLRVTRSTTLYFTTNVTPITEELVKILPVIYYAAIFVDDKKGKISKNSRISVITIAFAIGVGFAMLENIIILIRNISTANMLFAVIRGFSTSVMHSVSTMLIANFVPYIHANKKIYYCGTLCTFNLAVVFHSVFNLLVEAESGVANNIGYLLPIIIYFILNIFVLKTLSFKKKNTDIKPHTTEK